MNTENEDTVQLSATTGTPAVAKEVSLQSKKAPLQSVQLCAQQGNKQPRGLQASVQLSAPVAPVAPTRNDKMNMITEIQLAAMTEGQIAIAAAAQMRDLQTKIADIEQRFSAIRLCPDKACLMPALIANARALSAELQYVIEACGL